MRINSILRTAAQALFWGRKDVWFSGGYSLNNFSMAVLWLLALIAAHYIQQVSLHIFPFNSCCIQQDEAHGLPLTEERK
jgi:hypothetical protein